MKKPATHRCRIDGCRDVSTDTLCPTHRTMQSTIRAAQRGPISPAAVEAFLEALGRGYGEGEGSPAAYRGAEQRTDARTAPRPKHGAA